MAKRDLEVNGNIATWTMSVKGGNLPKEFEVFITVTMDFSDAKRENIVYQCASGQSIRVALQGQLRGKTTKELTEMSKTGLKTTFTTVFNGDVKRPIDRLMALSKEDFIETMVRDLGLDANQAEKIYNRKHGITE